MRSPTHSYTCDAQDSRAQDVGPRRPRPRRDRAPDDSAVVGGRRQRQRRSAPTGAISVPIGTVGYVSARERTATAGALSPGAFARDGQFRALAALARTSTPEAEPAARALAAKAAVADALDWLLVLDLTETQWAAVADALPAQVRLSDRHVRIIDRLVRDAIANPTTNAAAAAAKLVAALPAGPDRAKFARKFLAQSTGVLRDSGVRVLGSSTDPKDRALLVKDATHPGLELPDRLDRVDALGALNTTAEAKTAK